MGLCWFCDDEGTTPVKDYFVWICAPADYQGGSRTTIWDERAINIYRCETCQARHRRFLIISRIIWGLLWLAVGAYLYLTGDWGTPETTGYMVAGIIVSGYVAEWVSGLVLRLLGTKPVTHQKHHPDVAKMLNRPTVSLGRAPKSD